MNQTTSPGKTLSLVQVLGAEMSAIVGAEPGAPWANATRQVGELFVTLARFGCDWSLTLMDAQAVTHETCDQWATAVSAPSVEWTRTGNGLVCRCQWVGEGEEQPEVKAMRNLASASTRR